MKEIEIDRTDEEREELVKQWIGDYWLVIVAAVVLAIVALYGLDYYKQSKRDALDVSALQLQTVNQAISDNQLAEAEEQTRVLQADEKESSFASLASLALAKKYFDDKAYNKAIEQYDWLISNAGDVAMRDIARLRKARVQANNNQSTEALSILSSLEGTTSSIEVALLKGDILLADKQFDKAIAAYEAVMKSDDSTSVQLIQQRIDLVEIKKQMAK